MSSELFKTAYIGAVVTSFSQIPEKSLEILYANGVDMDDWDVMLVLEDDPNNSLLTCPLEEDGDATLRPKDYMLTMLLDRASSYESKWYRIQEPNGKRQLAIGICYH